MRAVSGRGTRTIVVAGFLALSQLWLHLKFPVQSRNFKEKKAPFTEANK